MKKIQYIALGLVMLSIPSCKDFFEPTSPSSLSMESVYSNPQRVESAIASIYEQFGVDKSYRNRLACGFQGLNTDIERSPKDNVKDPTAAAYATYSMILVNKDLSNSTGRDPWGCINIMIERASLAIEGIETYSDTTDAQFAYYLGEALFLRAFAYSELVKFWGDVPPRFASLTKDPDGMNIAKNDRNLVFDQIRKDLNRAAKLLPWSAECPGRAHDYTGRPSKAAALALLARVDLNYAGYALRPDFIQEGGGAPYKVQLNTKDETLRAQLLKEAMESCAQIINNEDTKLLDDYSQIFKNLCADVTTYSKSEYIWEIPFADGQRGQVMNYNVGKVDNCLKALKNNGSGSSNGALTLVPTLLYDFEKNDARRDVTISPYRWFANNGSDFNKDTAKIHQAMREMDPSKSRLYQRIQNVGELYCGKYRVEWMSRERNGNDEGVNFPIIRYADVILMFCEAAIGGITATPVSNTTGLDPQKQFDRIRTRAHLESKPLNMENLMEERKFEFAGEYIRKYDLQRWGKLKSALTNATNRIADLDAHRGDFANTGDTVWYKFKIDNSYLYTGNDATVDTCYIIDWSTAWGLKKGETTCPAEYDKDAGWVAKNIFRGEDGGHIVPPDYRLYINESDIDKRHFYPIFESNLATSNGKLWNDYDYK